MRVGARQRIERLGVPVESCHMQSGLPSPASLWRLGRHLRRARPHVVQTWLYHSDLLGALATKVVGPRTPVIWNIRINSLQADINKRTTFWTVNLCARGSRFLPSRIVVNTDAGKVLHAQLGYAAEKFVVIPNGFDMHRFRPSADARRLVREELGISGDTPLVGLIGRYHPQKDHATFLQAAANLVRQLPRTKLLLCGTGVDGSNEALRGLIDRHQLRTHCHLLGERDDIPNIQAALDVAVSSSVTEGFPNTIGEAMACGVVCVVTDAGGSPDVVGDTGRVVARQNPEALAAACLELLRLPVQERQQLGARARRRVEQNYSLDRVAQQYAELWQHVAGRRNVEPPSSARQAA